MRACLWVPGAAPEQGGFEPLCVSSIPAQKLGICELGRFLGETLNSNRNGTFFRFGNAKYPLHIWCCSIKDTGGSSVFRSKFPIFIAFPWAATAGKTGLKRQSLGSPKKIWIFQIRKLRFSASSEARCPFFQLFPWATTAGKNSFKRQSLGSPKDLSFSNSETEVFSVFRCKFPYFSSFSMGNYGWKIRF